MLVIAVVAVLLARTRRRVAALFLAAVLGGALGNLADRLFRAPGLGRGAVVDWIHVAWYPATFNLADLAIRVGAVGAVVAMLGAQARQALRPEPGSQGRLPYRHIRTPQSGHNRGGYSVRGTVLVR